jgi:hypothetical protein
MPDYIFFAKPETWGLAGRVVRLLSGPVCPYVSVPTFRRFRELYR